MTSKILERHLEDMFITVPELIEPGLIFIKRQIPLNNRKLRIDLQFKDQEGNDLFVEIKRRTFKRTDIQQIIAYYRELKPALASRVRLMVIAPRFRQETQHILYYLGIELKRFKLPPTREDLYNMIKIVSL